MYLCKFCQNPSTGSKDIASERSYADADADGICTRNNISPAFGWGDITNNIYLFSARFFYKMTFKCISDGIKPCLKKVKVIPVAKIFKNLLFQNHKAYDFGTWHKASGNGALQSLYKS